MSCTLVYTYRSSVYVSTEHSILSYDKRLSFLPPMDSPSLARQLDLIRSVRKPLPRPSSIIIDRRRRARRKRVKAIKPHTVDPLSS